MKYYMKRLFNAQVRKSGKKKSAASETKGRKLSKKVINGLAQLGITEKDLLKTDDELRNDEALAMKRWEALVEEICGTYPPPTLAKGTEI
jgi:hypothetical protein